ncbi:hypothetical protein [Sphingomonas baiyangensis]|uniref:Uncharacterized protein n=1 Tax=Sphingomonas baiyangensis TaxID=2572576 RepID=A0A4U1L9Y2_9SPHN|nr:hypothetical protein [Sphingomonas baiyangensis]TKD53146.1 hypothetical protein FBR43_02075 [Sphingomonas baiyangensis]
MPHSVPARPAMRRNRDERSFGLHPALFVATIAAYLIFLAIMGAAFMNGELVIPFAIFVIYIAMAFGTPQLWARMTEPRGGRFATWGEFLDEGIETGSGKLSGMAAVAQVMTLPVLIVAWGAIVAGIAASV